jgi:hypothetical protein
MDLTDAELSRKAAWRYQELRPADPDLGSHHHNDSAKGAANPEYGGKTAAE